MSIKKTHFNLIIVALFSLFLSCSSDDDSLIDNTKTEIEDNLKSNAWIISKYIDSGDDEIHHFNGYNFDFGTNNVLIASNGTNTYTGTWSITSSNSSDDSQDDLDFNISFATPEDFEELTDDWDIISQSATKIELIDISGGNGGTDYLTFERN